MFQDHGETVRNWHFHDLNAFETGGEFHSVDHLVTPSGSVLVHVDGRAVRDLIDPYEHHLHDETGGIPL